MRVGVIGTGTLAEVRAGLLVADPRTAWVGLAGSDLRRAAATSGRVGAHWSGSVEQILDAGLDAVVISSATADHRSHLSSAVRLGVPILCEKPLALTLPDSRAAAEQAELAGVQLQLGFQRRFDPALAIAHDRVVAGELGTIYLIRMASHDAVPPQPRFAARSGGMFRDLHVHDFDLARWLTGEEVEDVYAVSSRRTDAVHLDQLGDVDTTGIVLRMTSGLPVLISGARHDPGGHDVRVEILGSGMSLSVGNDARTPLTGVAAGPGGSDLVPADPYRGYLDRFRAAFAAETAAFLDLVGGRRANPCPPVNAIEALRIACAAEESAARRRPIRPKDVS